MARHLFPGDTIFTDVNNDDVAEIGDGVTITFWSESVGGTDYSSDVKAADGVTAANLTTDANGNIDPVRGPDGVLLMWRDTGNTIRYAVLAVDEVTDRLGILAAQITELYQLVADASGGGGGGLPAGTTLQDIPDGTSRLAMSPTERNKLGTVAVGATALVIGTTATTAKAGNYQPTPSQINAVENKGGVPAVWFYDGVGQPAGMLDNEIVFKTA